MGPDRRSTTPRELVLRFTAPPDPAVDFATVLDTIRERVGPILRIFTDLGGIVHVSVDGVDVTD
ncbi:hypothetical protein GFY24_00810 [Nocardia sp. SYP-A9097]|uniref:hypothetical protein n=1 Tax=Nocardia sp. SYP-A9097 TaxID=2663237 RepID=UPI00129A6C1C|nr:hypothetical protein [Nocardia sp. SYP-A9097]MRH86018.1 hypothetical protein [Nocardia sp. SYP-A9097]